MTRLSIEIDEKIKNEFKGICASAGSDMKTELTKLIQAAIKHDA